MTAPASQQQQPPSPASALSPLAAQAALSRDLADFLIELSIALHKNAIYPEGHPLVAAAVANLERRLTPLLETRGSLSLGVARHQLVIEGVATDDTNALLRELAGKLHRHCLGAVRFQKGARRDEIADFLRAVGEDAWRTGAPLGLEPDEGLRRWPNVRLYPLTYAQLELLDEQGDPVGADAEGGRDGDGGDDESPRPAGRGDRSLLGRTRAAQLWIGLARAALATQTAEGADAAAAAAASPGAPTRGAAPAAGAAKPPAATPSPDAARGGSAEPDADAADANASAEGLPTNDPVLVARAIDAHGRDVAYDQVVVGYLLQIADELKSKRGREAAGLQRRISRLVGSLQPETLRRLLDMGGDMTQRRRFVLDASQGLAVDAVVELVRAAADMSRQTISHSMVRMLSKLAQHAEGAAVPVKRAEADVAFREQVERLMSGWQLDDPNPDAYRRALEGLSRAAPVIDTPEHALPAEPERVVQMALEVGAVGDAVIAAADALANRGRLTTLFDWLDAAPPTPARDALWSHLATVERLADALAAPSPDAALLERLARRLGYAACAPILDAIEGAAGAGGAGDDARRVQALGDLLAAAGPDASAAAAERVAGARWPVQRALLATIARLGAPPAGFSAVDYARHAVAEVRREALQLMLATPAERDAAVCAAVADPDPRVVVVGLRAALAGGCPAAAVATLFARADDAELPAELRGLAVRAVATHDDPDVVRWLVDRVTARRLLRGGLRLAPKTPETLVALTALAERWREHALAAPVLALARESDDAEVRRAVAPRRGARPTLHTGAVDAIAARAAEAWRRKAPPNERAGDDGEDAA